MGYERRKEVLHNAIRGWVSYFKYADAKENLRAIDEWLRRRIRHCWDTTKSIIGCKEPPYADPHVRWCERSVNESRR